MTKAVLMKENLIGELRQFQIISLHYHPVREHGSIHADTVLEQ